MPEEPIALSATALLAAASYANSFREADPWIRSTGFRSSALRFSNLSYTEAPRCAEEFLVNSRLSRSDVEARFSIDQYFTDHSIVLLGQVDNKPLDGLNATRLPKGPQLNRPLQDVIMRRRSCRMYSGDSLSLAALAAIVRSAAAITAEVTVALRNGSEATLHFRAVPSGGGLYPIDLWVASHNVRGLPRGVFRYEPVADSLVPVFDAEVLDRLLDTFCVPEEIISLRAAGAIVILTGRPWRSMRKYGSRGLRFVFMEAGAIAEHVHLAAVALGVGSVDCASYYDDEIHETLALDGICELVLHTIILGMPGD